MTRQRPPNILLLMTDQHNPVLMGPDNPFGLRTPNLDRLAAEGTTFDNAYCASPICVPSRASFMSGLAPHKHQALDNGTSMPGTIPTFAHALTAAGYETVLCARMHFNGLETHHGFEKRLASDICNPIEYGVPGHTPPVIPSYAGVREGEVHPYTSSPSSLLTYDDHLADRACAYLRDDPGDERPFLLCASFYGPHPMMSNREVYRELYEEYHARDLGAVELSREDFDSLPPHIKRFTMGADGSSRVPSRAQIHEFRAAYFSRVTYTDQLIGKVLDTLEEEGLKEDTVILYVSDHGEQMGDHGTIGKSTFYEYSARVPFILSMPDRAEGHVCHNVSLVDVFPTLCDVAGVEIPDVPLDGESVLPLLKGGTLQRGDCAYSELHHFGADQPMFMLKEGDWKYCLYAAEAETLYHLGEDPKEMRNYALEPDYQDVLNHMRRALRDHVDPEEVSRLTANNRRQRRLIYQAVENGPDTRKRLRERINTFRENWDEPFWDDNRTQSVHEAHLKWEEEPAGEA